MSKREFNGAYDNRRPLVPGRRATDRDRLGLSRGERIALRVAVVVVLILDVLTVWSVMR